MKIHMKLVLSAENISCMKAALSEIVSRIEYDETVLIKHDDYEYNYDIYSSEILKIFDCEPENFVDSDGYPNK